MRYLHFMGFEAVCACGMREAGALCGERGLAAMVVSLEVRRVRGVEGGGEGWVEDTDGMDEEMDAVIALQRRAPETGCVMLCPLKQLSHAATYRALFPCRKSTLLSRPTRLCTLHAALQDCLLALPHDRGAPEPPHTQGAAAGRAGQDGGVEGGEGGDWVVHGEAGPQAGWAAGVGGDSDVDSDMGPDRDSNQDLNQGRGGAERKEGAERGAVVQMRAGDGMRDSDDGARAGGGRADAGSGGGGGGSRMEGWDGSCGWIRGRRIEAAEAVGGDVARQGESGKDGVNGGEGGAASMGVKREQEGDVVSSACMGDGGAIAEGGDEAAAAERDRKSVV